MQVPPNDSVSLRFVPGQPRVRLRELTSAEERSVAGTTTDDALFLLDALVFAPPGEPAPPRAHDLVASDRDRLLVAIYRRNFGDKIENTLTCELCDHPFDIDFSLGGLAMSLETPGSTRVRPLGQNQFETAEGLRFRLPTGRDERAIAALPASEAENALLRCCTVGDAMAPAPAEAAGLQELLAEVAPLIDLDLDARCPECGRTHSLQFDIQSYLLGALLGERRRLAQEMHLIAIAYGWGLQEILSLGRHERRQFVELISNENAVSSRRHFG